MTTRAPAVLTNNKVSESSWPVLQVAIFICSPMSLNMSEKELGKTSKQVCLVVPVRIFSRIDVMAGVDVWLDYFRP